MASGTVIDRRDEKYALLRSLLNKKQRARLAALARSIRTAPDDAFDRLIRLSDDQGKLETVLMAADLTATVGMEPTVRSMLNVLASASAERRETIARLTKAASSSREPDLLLDALLKTAELLASHKTDEPARSMLMFLASAPPERRETIARLTRLASRSEDQDVLLDALLKTSELLASRKTNELARSMLSFLADASQELRLTIARLAMVASESEPPEDEDLKRLVRLTKDREAFDGLLSLAAQLQESSVTWRECSAMFASSPDAAASLQAMSKLLTSPKTQHLVLPLLHLIARAQPNLRHNLAKLATNSADSEGAQDYHFVPDIYGRMHYVLHDVREDDLFKETADRVIEPRLTLLYYDRLFNLYEAFQNVSRLYAAHKLNLAEVGVYRGGASYFLCDLTQRLHGGNANFYAIDTFEGHSAFDLPEGSEGIHSPSMFSETSAEQVTELLAEFPFAKVIARRIQDCSDLFESTQFHMIHLDVDVYEPTAFALRMFVPRLAPGGIICVDDYNKTTCPGVRQAVDEIVEESSESLIKLYTQTAQCLLVRAEA